MASKKGIIQQQVLSDEELRVAAQALYDKNLSMLVEKARSKRSMWRITLDDAGVIVNVGKCRPGKTKPERDSFVLIVPGDSKEPKFGSLNGLSGYQVGIAQLLEQDLKKLFAVNQVAYCLTKSPKLGYMAKEKALLLGGLAMEQQLETYSERFGQLPKSEAQVIEENDEVRKISLRNKEMEKLEVLSEEPLSFEVVLEQERREMAKQNREQRRQKLKARIRRIDMYSSSTDSETDPDEDYGEEKDVEEQKYSEEQKANKYFKYFYRLNNQRYQYIYIYT
eukprot:CAMPEP_0204836070 /NCGR_PEP_ID=MMETSP1346-20131115/24235_1 /ASSEMBLY_ACC=CAM_ASM_000771 /TAXON_ID=215587 /ORGANISM="Aplanochytrium stocchinoi, Strain GSBS06" /LENGTH=278 /DNA_ID=CAMNT_0051970535 /DNA_START=612 /DNA_END=1448 /DNA_ORIENTATION=-